MVSYRYDNIVDSDHVIRVLTLSPGRDADPLHGQLETCRLDKALAYDALSYCWGTGEMDAIIDCSQGSILITETLERALKVLRLEDKTRRLWIDQICINQDNKKERSSQVRLMYEIYSLAQRTIVWLGDDEKEHGPVVRQLFSDLEATGAECRNYGFSTTTPLGALQFEELLEMEQVYCRINEEDQKMTANKNTFWFPTDDVLDQCGLPRRSSHTWSAFNALLRSQYFTRVWTLQEVLSSREAVVVWGTTELPWPSLRVAYRWAMLNHCFIEDPHEISDSPKLEKVQFIELELDWFRGLRSGRLADLVKTTREGLQATDPRDQIYAFISLASDGQDFSIDYDKSEEDVYRDFSKHCVLQRGDLSMLNFAGLHRDDGLRLPSWVPSWSSRVLFWNTAGCDHSVVADLNDPLFPLAGEEPSKIRRPRYYWKSEGFLADRPDQLLIKGYRLPRDQAKVVCTHLAYSIKDPVFVPIAAQYHELSHNHISPSTCLREMVSCMTSAERNPRFDDHELLSQFINFISNSILKDFEQSAENLDRFVPGLEMIRLASDAMESRVISTDSTLSRLSSTSQEWIESLVRRAYSYRLSQEKLDKVVKAISGSWGTEGGARFDGSLGVTGIGRKLFVTTQGRLGIGPARMTTTDVIIIAYGGLTPFVLRPVPGTHMQEYLLLGDCYIHNLMDGAAIPQVDDPPAEWFRLSEQPRQDMDTAAASGGTKEAGNIDLQSDIGGSQGDI